MSAFVAGGRGRRPTSPIGLQGWEAIIHFENPTPASTLPPRLFSPLHSYWRQGEG
jgi:hypothetical protein